MGRDHRQRTFLGSDILSSQHTICKLMQERQEWSGTPKQFKEVLYQRFPDSFATWYRSPRKYVDELEKIAPALREEGIEVSIPPNTTLVTLTKTTTEGHPS